MSAAVVSPEPAGWLVEVVRGEVVDLVRVVSGGDSPTGQVVFVVLDEQAGNVEEVRVRWTYRGRGGARCDVHGRPRPACRHIASAVEALGHVARESQRQPPSRAPAPWAAEPTPTRNPEELTPCPNP